MKKIILASTSPRRKLLMEKICKVFEIISPDFDECLLNKTFEYEKIEDIAEKKCNSVAKNIIEPAVIISADTVVVYDNMVMGKPKDYEEAFKMLSLLSGNTHKVVTAVCVFDTESHKKLVKSETSKVMFNELASERINSYIYNYKPYDKAGSYGIQELPDDFVSEIQGDYDNIVGFPVNLVKNMLGELSII